MRLLPTSEQISDDLNDLKLRIAKMNARRNAQINLLQRKVMGGSLRSKYNPWSREYYRRLYNTYPHLYPFGAYPWRSSSLDSLELDKYYDSLNLDNKFYTYESDDPLYSKYKRIANPPNTDLLSKLKDFVFEQERQMTTDLLRKITEDRKLRSGPLNRESNSLSRYEPSPKNDPPFLNPINKKDNFYKRYNAFVKKILKPLRKSSPVKYEPPKTPRPCKDYLSSYLDDYYYPSQVYRPYWYRYSSPYYRRYLYDYLPKIQPASVPLDVESIMRKSNIDDRNYKPIKKNYAPVSTYKYDPFESDSYLRSSLPTWKQYYYTQKLKSKPSNECFLDYYDPYYDFFPDRASVDSTDDLSNEDDANQIVDEYRDAIYEDIIQNLREKQSKRTALRADRKLFGYRGIDQEHPARDNERDLHERDTQNLYNSDPYSNVYRYPRTGYGTAESKFTSYKDSSNKTYFPNVQQDVDIKEWVTNPTGERNNFVQSENYKTNDETKLPNETQTRQNVVSPSIFNSFNKYSRNLSPSKTKSTWNTDGKSSPRTEDTSKLEQYRSSTLNKVKSVPTENKEDSEVKISEYIPNSEVKGIYDYRTNGIYDSEVKGINEYKPNDSEVKRISEYKPNSNYEKRIYDYQTNGNYDSEVKGINEYKPNDSEVKRISEYKPNSNYEKGIYDYKTNGNYDSEVKGINEYKPNDSEDKIISEYKPSSNDSAVRRSEYKPIDEYQADSSGYRADISGEFQSDTSPTRYSKTVLPSAEQNKFTPINSPTKPELRPSNSFENPVLSEKLSSTKSQLHRPSYPPENEISSLVPETDKFQRKNSLEERQESYDLPASRFQRLSSGSVGGRDSNADSHSDPQKHPNSTKPTTFEERENFDLERRSSARSRTPTDRSTISRRNSVIFDRQSRRNSAKPTLQRRNSVQPAEKRSMLQKMNHETRFDGDSNENSAESYSIEEQNEEMPSFQKRLSKDDVFAGVDELARKNSDSAEAYDEARVQKAASYFDENPYEENSKDSYGRDVYAKEQKFYPEYDNEDNPTKSYYPEQTYSEPSLDNEPKSYDYPKDFSQKSSTDEYTRSQEQPQSGLDSYISQSSNDSHSKSFQQSDADLSINHSPVRTEPKEQEPSLNSINEETEKTDDKPEITNVQQTSAETAVAASPTKKKRSVDLGKSTVPTREFLRRGSRSNIMAQAAEEKKLKNQSSAGELQKRLSKPKIGEGKLRKTASSFKVLKPTVGAKKA